MCLSRVLPSQNQNGRFLDFVFLVNICDFHEGDVDAGIAFANWAEFDELEGWVLGHILDLADVGLELGVSVRDGVGTVHFVAWVLETVVESHIVVRFWFMWIQLVYLSVVRTDFILNIETALKPTLTLLTISPRTPKTRFHSIVKKRISFGKIYNIDPYFAWEVLRCDHSEVKPLQVGVAVGVISHPQIIDIIFPPPDLVNIATLEVRVKNDSVRTVLFINFRIIATHFHRAAVTHVGHDLVWDFGE